MTLDELLTNYLAARGVDLDRSTTDPRSAVLAQADYVRTEVNELHDAVADWYADGEVGHEAKRLRPVRHEIADVVLAATRLARLVGTTVEDCIDEKTEHDRGRG
jgi:hypothetical protein